MTTEMIKEYMEAFDGKIGHEGEVLTAQDSKTGIQFYAIKDINGKFYCIDGNSCYHIDDELVVVDYLKDQNLIIVDFEESQEKTAQNKKVEAFNRIELVKRLVQNSLSFAGDKGYSKTKSMSFEVINQLIQGRHEPISIIKYEDGTQAPISLENLKKLGIKSNPSNITVNCYQIKIDKTSIDRDEITRIAIRIPQTDARIWVSDQWIIDDGNSYIVYLPHQMNYFIGNNKGLISAKEICNSFAE